MDSLLYTKSPLYVLCEDSHFFLGIIATKNMQSDLDREVMASLCGRTEAKLDPLLRWSLLAARLLS